MSLLDGIISIFAPYDCLGCEEEGSLLCPACAAGLLPAPPVGRLSAALSDVRAAVRYDGLAKSLVWHLKFAGAQSAVRCMADFMVPFVVPNRHSVIVPVPTATTRIRSRGYDQTYLLARELAKKTGCPMRPLLSRNGQARQVGATRKRRLMQLQDAFYTSADLQEVSVLLVDDVLTTGATMEAAAKVLLQAGAVRIDALTFAYSP